MEVKIFTKMIKYKQVFWPRSSLILANYNFPLKTAFGKK